VKRLSSRAGRFALWKFIALAASGNCREASELLGRYLKAGEGRDLDSLVSLLEEDTTYIMPPLPQWYAGRAAMRAFSTRHASPMAAFV